MTFDIFDRFDPQVLVTGLGEEYAISENYFKPYPSCRFTHPALDALEEVLREKKISPAEIAGISVDTFNCGSHGVEAACQR